MFEKIAEERQNTEAVGLHLVSKYKTGKSRPVKVIFQSSSVVDETVRSGTKLNMYEEYKYVKIRRGLSWKTNKAKMSFFPLQ